MSRRTWALLIAGTLAGALVLIALWVLPRLARRVGVSIPGGSPGPVNLQLPSGFAATIFARGLDGPRFMAYDDQVLFVAEMGAGRIVALPDWDLDGTSDEARVVIEGLARPSSLAFHQGWCYVGETGQIVRLRIDENLNVIEKQVIVPNLPTGGAHTTRTVLIGPKGRLYVAVGSSCNVCLEEDERRAAIYVYGDGDSQGSLFAKGLRNAVGLAVDPWTGELWATNNGRDWLGDDSPPDTVYIVRKGHDYGWPRCHNGRIIDPEFGQRDSCDGVEAPAIEFPAHSAPLGLAFYNGDQFPEEYRGDLFVALHGSWNRSQPTGYKVVHIPRNGNKSMREVLDFATGWLQENGRTAPGRPVGVTVAPDGALMISDDKAGIIYRVSYRVVGP